jgi:hypothetical protein
MAGQRGKTVSTNKPRKEVEEIAQAVSDILHDKFEALEEKIDNLEGTLSNCISKQEFEKTKCIVRVQRYQMDNLEQYTRRENIRIHGLKEGDDAMLVADVLQLLNCMLQRNGMSVVNGDSQSHTVTSNDSPRSIMLNESHLSACHRIGKKKSNGQARQVFVRFVYHVLQVLRSKKTLASLEEYKHIFISDDLTQLRVRMKSVLKDTPGVSNVYSRDGVLFCTKEKRQFSVTSPDDFHALDIDINLKDLGLESLE